MDFPKEELDAFVDMVLAYAKKHELSYVISIGKKINDQYAVMDSWWEPNPGHLEPMCRSMLKGEGSVPTAMKWAIIEEAREFSKKNTH